MGVETISARDAAKGAGTWAASDLSWFRSNPAREFRIRPPDPGEGIPPGTHMDGREVWMLVLQMAHKGMRAHVNRPCLRPDPGEETNPWVLAVDGRCVRFSTWRRVVIPNFDLPDEKLYALLQAESDEYGDHVHRLSMEAGAHCAMWARRGHAGIRPLRGADFADVTELDMHVHVVGCHRLNLRSDDEHEDDGEGGTVQVVDDAPDYETATERYSNMIGRLQHIALAWEAAGGVVYRLSPELVTHLLREDLDLEDGPSTLPRTTFALDLSFARPEDREAMGPATLQAVIVSRYVGWDDPTPPEVTGLLREFWDSVGYTDDLTMRDLSPETRALRDTIRAMCCAPRLIMAGLEGGAVGRVTDYGARGMTGTWRGDVAEVARTTDDKSRALRRLVLNFSYLHAMRVRVQKPLREPRQPSGSRPKPRPGHKPQAVSVAADATILLPRRVVEAPSPRIPGPSAPRDHLVEAEVTRAQHTRRQAYGPGRAMTKEIVIAERPHTRVYRRPDHMVRRINTLLDSAAAPTPEAPTK